MMVIVMTIKLEEKKMKKNYLVGKRTRFLIMLKTKGKKKFSKMNLE
jgi:hypothetical protein